MAALERLVPWLVGAGVVTLSLAAMYMVAQQTERLGADDAPARLASEIAADVPAARDSITTRESVALETNLQPFFVVYDSSGVREFGTGSLNGELAQVPVGVIEAAFANGTNSVTWQPDDGLRFATVSVRAGDEVVLAGQSLEPSESRTDRIHILLLLAWLASIVALGVGAFLHIRLAKRA